MYDTRPQSWFYDYDHWSALFYSFAHSVMMKRKYEIENNFEYDVVIKSRSKKGKVKLSGDPRLGYISSVEKKRQSLEELFKSDSKEP